MDIGSNQNLNNPKDEAEGKLHIHPWIYFDLEKLQNPNTDLQGLIRR